MQLADGVGGAAVSFGFFGVVGEFAFHQKHEPVGLLRQLGELALVITAARLQVINADAGEVAGDNVARTFFFLERQKIFAGLTECCVEVFAFALMFDDEFAGDEAVDEALRAAELLDRLFVDGGTFCTDAEALIKTQPESLRLAAFVARSLLLFGKSGKAFADFVAG